MKTKLFALASLFIAVSLVLAGCATPATPQVVEKTVEVTKVVEVTVAAPPPAAPEGGEIAVIVKTGNSSFWQNVQTGAMDAQNELQA